MHGFLLFNVKFPIYTFIIWFMEIKDYKPFKVKLNDISYKYSFINHERKIARAILFDDEGYFYFVNVTRNDEFGKCSLIETSGGGVNENETYRKALKRELKEELGAEVKIICYLGEVIDFYNLIHRKNLNHYFLCKVNNFKENNLTSDEINKFHLKTLKVKYDEAIDLYKKYMFTKLGRLLYNREMIPLLAIKDFKK